MNIIVVGCGRVGSYLAKLLSDDGHNVSVVDYARGAFAALDRDFNGRTIKGIGYAENVLKEAGVEECDALVAVTSDDNTNLMIAEVGRHLFNVERVIARLYSPDRERTYTQLGVDYSCGTTLVAEEIYAKIQAQYGHHLDTFGSYEVMHFALNLEEGQRLSCAELEHDYDARVICIGRDDDYFMPDRNSQLRDSDDILVCVSKSRVSELTHFMRS